MIEFAYCCLLVATVGYSRLPRGYRGLQQVTESNRVVTVGYSRLPSVYSGLQQVTESNRVVTVGYSKLQQGTG